MKVSLLHPSRSRPDQSWQCVNDWVNRAGCEIEVIVSLDTDDPRLEDYKKLYGDRFKVIVNTNRSAVDAMNQAAQHSTGDLIVASSDDFACPRNWALILEKHCKNWNDFLLKVDDGQQKYIVTLPIMDRAYYNRFGYIYHPDYLHQFCDTHLTHVADVLRRLQFRNDIMFRHNHKKNGNDELYKRNDRTWEDGKRTYIAHVKNKFGFPRTTDVTSLAPEGQGHKQWLQKHGIW